MIPLKYQFWFREKILPNKVDEKPTMITGNEESVRYIQLDDKKIILNVSGWRVTSLVWVMLLLAGAKGMSDGIVISDIEWLTIRGTVEIISLFISIVSIVLAIIAVSWFVFYRKKYVIFDRDKGTVSIPGPFWYKDVEIQFNKVSAVVSVVNQLYGTGKVLYLYRPDGYFVDVGINKHDLKELRRDWAFYVWYMDKSRPLPPAPVFDKYRQTSSFKSALGNVS